MALLERLNTDRSLAAFAGQFVPLKLVVNSKDDEWSSWTKRFRHQGNGIPILYVIRADGEKLYAQSGSLRGDELPKMLLAALQRAGRVFSPVEVQVLKSSVDQAEQALKADDPIAAARAVSALRQLGELGQFQSYAESSIRADQIVAELVQYARSTMQAAAQATAEENNNLFPAVLSLVELETAFSDFSQLKPEMKDAIRQAKRNKAARSHFKPAESLIRARQYAATKTARTRRRAVSSYELVITRYPDSPASDLAKQELSEIDPNSAVLANSRPTTNEPAVDETNENRIGGKQQYRTWTDRSGKFKITAKLVEFRDGKVQLQKSDGSSITLPIGRLSAEDREFLDKLQLPK